MPNYTITTKTTGEPSGAAINSQSGEIFITPNSGFVVGASDFSVTNVGSLAGIASASIADVGTAFAIDNTVKITVVTDSSGFNITDDAVRSLAISGNARRFNASNANNNNDLLTSDFNFTINNNLDSTVTVTSVTSQNSGITISGTGSNPINVSGGVQYSDGDVKVLAADIELDATSTNILDDLPNLAENLLNFNNEEIPDDALTTIVKSSTQNSSGETTGVTLSLYANTKHPIPASAAAFFDLAGDTRPATPTTVQIKNIDFGSETLNPYGDTREIKVYGDIGATFDLDIKESGTSITGFPISETIVKSGSLTKGESVFTKSVDFASSVGAAKTYSITIDETGTTTRGSALGDFHSGIPTFEINQYVNPKFTLSFHRTGVAYSEPTSIVVNGRPNIDGSALNYLKDYSSVKDYTFTIVAGSGTFTVNSAKFAVTDSGMFHTDGDAYDDSRVSLLGLSAAGNGTNTLTLSITVMINKFTTSDLTYDINIGHFAVHS